MAFADHMGPLLRTTLEVLRDADGPLTRRETFDEVERRVEIAPDYLTAYPSGEPRWRKQLGWRVMEAAALGWVTRRGGWSITEAGLQALEDYPGAELYRQVTAQYRAKQQSGKKYADPKWAPVAEAIARLEPGMWTSHVDLAALNSTAWNSIWGFLGEQRPAAAHRVLLNDGRISDDFKWFDPERTDDPREVLEREGLEFDAAGRANPARRLTTDDFREMFAELAPEPVIRRAWLVRGSSVDGRDLVPVWLHKGSVSLAAASLPEIPIPIDRDQLRMTVDGNYQHKSYAVRETKLTEFDAFSNRMRPGDYVLTTTQGKAYVGVLAGDASYVASSDQRSNLRRAVDWLNETQPVPFAHLPQPLPAKLHSQSDVVELTENIPAIEELLAALDITLGETEPEPVRVLAFPEIGQDLADDILITREDLQRLADLLWENKQLILYGPPGTGKTFLARKLAGQLAEPSAVKLVQFHPSYTYEDFFEGFRPVQRTDGQLAFDLRPGPFRQLVEAARQHPSDPYILIIDEINRANLAKVFGELYFLLEYRDDAIGLLYSAESDFTLPPNVFVIGTMNTTDRSIALVDAAMRRRFRFVELHPSHAPIQGLLDRWLARLRNDDELAVHNVDAPEILDALNTRIEDHDLAIGPSYLMKPSIYQRESGLAEVWETAILPLLAEQHYGSPLAVLDRYRLPALRQAVRQAAPEAEPEQPAS
ncbi:AAA family ATPase [Nonomuraea jiangxiensis]|uniref:5-methylcytosine-specific restriction enzyme B n=1 Tax=Nonomuraea jiangxiensis TaxID=633440 RepID=A0A1G9LN52_9ACTN|nr:AAA family ATPase [Nonomuraea jiangxiensis]SDL63271.1 5-methylcytosine-specific restriction enzyme B [Nonomuraea jiangxiensis]